MDIRILKSLYMINSYSGKEDFIKQYLYEVLDALPFAKDLLVKEDKKGNVYVTKGETKHYPCYVAHLDEVHQSSPTDIINVKGILFGFNTKKREQVGIGADDKNGIFVTLCMLERLPAVKIAWFVEEETGCKGSYKADMKFFKDCLWVIQADRRNGSDLITSIGGRDMCSNDFRKDILKIGKGFGYKKESGLMTDIETLVNNDVGISCVNISCGYYFPHTNDECTDIKELQNCIQFCEAVGKGLIKKYPHVPEKKSYKNYYDDYVWNNVTKTYDYRKEEYNGGKLVTRAGRKFHMYGTKVNPWYQEISTKKWYKENEMPKEPVVQRPSKPDFDAIPCNSCRNNFDCMNCDWYNTEQRID